MNKGQATRQRIIETAAPLFNQMGYAGCSMADIMAATGMEKGGIYRYFATKEALAVAAFQHAASLTRKLRTDDLAHLPCAADQLRAAIDRFITEPSPIAGGCPLLNAAVDSDDGNVEIRNLVRDAFRDWRKRLAAIVQQGVRSHEFLPGTRPAELADTIVAALEGALILTRMDGDKKALRHAQTSLNHVIAAHRCPGSTQRSRAASAR